MHCNNDLLLWGLGSPCLSQVRACIIDTGVTDRWGAIQGVFLKALPSPWTSSFPGSKNWGGYRKKCFAVITQTRVESSGCLLASAVPKSWVGSSTAFFPPLVFHPPRRFVHQRRAQPVTFPRDHGQKCSHSLIFRAQGWATPGGRTIHPSWQPGQGGRGRNKNRGTQG